MSLFGAALDASVVLSFGVHGFEEHRRRFDPAPLPRLDGKTVLVSGANSGLGLAASRQLAALGATVVLACRDLERGRAAQATVAGRTELVELDVAQPASLARFAAEWGARPLHGLVNNAGLLVDQRTVLPDGLELTFATNALGSARLTQALLPALRAGQGQVVFVSSGGMYLVRLELRALQGLGRRYDGTTAYAQTKRAQVVLNELLAAREPAVGFAAMHPGWARTPGVERSLPRFARLTGAALRTADQGADTVTWLLATSAARTRTGRFWFDRAEVPTHLLPWTREDGPTRAGLAQLLGLVAG